jgi:hypothetical protein
MGTREGDEVRRVGAVRLPCGTGTGPAAEQSHWPLLVSGRRGAGGVLVRASDLTCSQR